MFVFCLSALYSEQNSISWAATLASVAGCDWTSAFVTACMHKVYASPETMSLANKFGQFIACLGVHGCVDITAFVYTALVVPLLRHGEIIRAQTVGQVVVCVCVCVCVDWQPYAQAMRLFVFFLLSLY